MLKSENIVSVPCRGTTFLNMENEEMSKADLMFPSPVGELHFSITSEFATMMKLFVSVPCRGTTFLNGIHFFSDIPYLMFPSPVGELHFSIPSLQSRHQSGLMVGIAWEKYFWKNK